MDFIFLSQNHVVCGYLLQVKHQRPFYFSSVSLEAQLGSSKLLVVLASLMLYCRLSLKRGFYRVSQHDCLREDYFVLNGASSIMYMVFVEYITSFVLPKPWKIITLCKAVLHKTEINCGTHCPRKL